MRTVRVELGERSYPILIGKETLSAFPEVCHEHAVPKRIGVITDANVAGLYLRPLMNMLRRNGFEPLDIVIPQGERQKSLARAKSIYERLLQHQFDRSSALIAFGGGVVGDLTGYVAATYRRGIPCVQVPTTLLGQVESSIGGKVGVNHASRKNAVGVFYQPAFVFSDVNLLTSLPRREVVCGLGELLKYAYLSQELFTLISEHLDGIMNKDLDIIEEIVARCNVMKAKMISEDERDLSPTGGRMVLNLGHTIGHALEVLSNYRLHHGEAVLIGLRWELSIAEEMQCIGQADFERLDGLLQRVRYDPNIDFISRGKLISAIFGKNPRATFILPRAVGKVEKVEIDRSLAQSVLKKVKAGR